MSANLTLQAYFVRLYCPTYLAGAAVKTIRAYTEALGHWRRIVGEIAIGAIRVEHLARFKAELLAGLTAAATAEPRQRTFFDVTPRDVPALAKATVNKHLRAVCAMLNKAGPAGPRNRDALGLIPSVPWVKPVREPHRLPHAVRAADIVAAYNACDVAKHPRLEGVRAEYWWKALVITAYTAAFRRGGLLSLLWDDVDLANESIRLQAEGDKCWHERSKPLHHAVVLHLIRIRTRSPLVFPWPSSERTYYRTWDRIQEAAEIPAERRFGMHDLKRTAGTVYGSKSRSPWLVQAMLDHASLSTSKAYVNPADDLRPAVDAFPLPGPMLADVGEDRPGRNHLQAT